MKNRAYFLLCTLILWCGVVFCETEFGYVAYSGGNIGDDIQAIAARRFLSKESIPIERDLISQFQYEKTIPTIVNGWFMQTKDNGWPFPSIPPFAKSWPPSSAVDPLLISMHISPDSAVAMFSNEGIQYFIKHGPVGARDFYTLQELQKRKIPSYFSGCLTLTLENSCTQREPVIYAVDITDQCLSFLKSKTLMPVVRVTHSIPFSRTASQKERLQIAEELLHKYRQATCVITERLHAALPCLAFGTPVVLILKDENDPRFFGLKDLVYHCTRDEFLSGKMLYNFDSPPNNPTTYLPLREALIQTVTSWVEKKQKNYGEPSQEDRSYRN